MSATNSAKIISNFFLSFVLDGLILNSGYIFHAIKKQWSWEGSVAIIPLNVNKALSGILGAIFILRTCSKDSRSAILWGSLLCATGIGFSSITKDISWLIVFWGAVFGTGYAITSTYLQKDLATPGKETTQKIFLKCAPNVGGVLLPFVLEQLFDQYDLTGSCLIMCGIILNYIPLSLLAFYNIGPKWNRVKWTMRKRSSKYKVNISTQVNMSVGQSLKQKNSFKNKVIASCLEPDIVSYKLSIDNEAFENDHDKSISNNSTEKGKDSLVLEIKKSALNVPNIIEDSNMEVLEKHIKNFPNGSKLAEVILDIEKYENDHKIFEDDFYAKDTTVDNNSSLEVGSLKENSNATSLTSDESDKNMDLDSELSSRTEIINNSPSELPSTNCSNSVSTLSNSNPNETPLSSVKKIEQFSPDMFKVNVLECTFESESDYINQISQPIGKSLKKNNYRQHANSLITQNYENIDFTEASARNKELFGKNYDRSKQVENIYNVCDKDKYKISYKSPKTMNASTVELFQDHQTNLLHKLKQLFKTLKLLTNRECLLVLLITIIAEYITTVLIVLICSFAEETQVKEADFKWIIAAFGAGGILGKYCFYYINKSLTPKISIASAILFMLNSLAIIGVLWSNTLKWYINFYLILGILQSCIQASFTKIREVYIHANFNLYLSSASKLLFGIIILSLPHLIQFTRSFSGDFELLLEIIGCCSALCAILCFSLQKCSLCCIVK